MNEIIENKIENKLPEYCRSSEEVRAFARILVDAEILEDADGVMDYWEKPWHWSKIYDIWLSCNKPSYPYLYFSELVDYIDEPNRQNLRDWNRFIGTVLDMYRREDIRRRKDEDLDLDLDFDKDKDKDKDDLLEF